MIVGCSFLIVLAGVAGCLHYFGAVADELAVERDQLEAERNRLVAWAAKLTVVEVRGIGCTTSAECARNLHLIEQTQSLYDWALEELAAAPSRGGDPALTDTVPSVGARSPGDAA